MQQDRTVRIVLNSVSYNHDKKHYVFDYWEDSMTKHLRVLRVKSLTVFGFKDFKKVERKINRDELFDFIDELKQVSNKVYLPNKELPIDFSTNWVKGKKVAITGELRSLNDKLMSVEKRLFPVIRMLGGNPIGKISLDTDILITLDKDLENNYYKFAIGNKIPTANLLELMELVETELHKNLSDIIGSNFLIYV
jgi:NAD-dependent DNA ligase